MINATLFRPALPLRVLALLVAGVWGTGTASAQVLLQYRYSPHEHLQYELKQSLTTSAIFDGQRMENTLAQQLLLSTDVEQVGTNGSAKVCKKICRIRMQATQPGQSELLEYDSNSPHAAPGPLGMLVNSMSQLVDQDIKMVVSRQGEATHVELPTSLEKMLSESAGGVAGINSLEGIKRMIAQGSIILPDHPVAVQDQWTRELTADLPFGTMKSTILLTYAGVTKEGLHRIDAVSKISLTPRSGAAFDVTMKAADGRGVYLFDADRGCVYASALKQAMDLELSAAGQTLQQHVVTDITLRLIEPQAPRTAERP